MFALFAGKASGLLARAATQSAWIESHAALRDHPKLKRLARSLGISRREATGLLHWLWWWAMDYAPDGDLTDYTADDIADGVDWDGDPDKFITALRDAGFLDGQMLHDWDEYGGKLQYRRRANAQRMRQARKPTVPDPEPTPAPPVPPTKPARATHVQSTFMEHAEREDIQDIQDIQDRQETPFRAPAREAPEWVTLFHELCPSLPRILNVTEPRKKRAAKLLKELGEDGLRTFFAEVEASDILAGRALPACVRRLDRREQPCANLYAGEPPSPEGGESVLS